jgi:hypothetical protein
MFPSRCGIYIIIGIGPTVLWGVGIPKLKGIIGSPQPDGFLQAQKL